MKDGIPKLANALVNAQAELKNPGFDAKNPHFKSRFASLPAVRNAVIPVFNKHRIALTQAIHRGQEGGVACTTYLIHESGEWMAYPPIEMPVPKQDPQGVASASTYARRYALQAVAGVVGDEDDDGESAVGRQEPTATSGWGVYETGAAQKLADKLTDVSNNGTDDEVQAATTAASADQDLYKAAWQLVSAANRKAIKDAIERVKNAKVST